MKNYALILEYDGTNYCGFQRQKNGVAIQEVLENAIFEATKFRSSVTPSGRTDAKVHALGQVVNFCSPTNIPADKLSININLYLPKDIRVKKSFEVNEDFNARKSAKKKTYIYKIVNQKYFSVFDENRALYYPYDLDFTLLQKGTKLLCGTHDFSAFVASGASTQTTIRTIYQAGFHKDGHYLIFKITGNGFLYNMVRIIVGTLLEVGRSKRSLDNFKALLSGGKRKDSGKTVSPSGLYLANVEYDECFENTTSK